MKSTITGERKECVWFVGEVEDESMKAFQKDISELGLEMRWGCAKYLQATLKGSFSLIIVCVIVGTICYGPSFLKTLVYSLKQFNFLAVMVRNQVFLYQPGRWRSLF